jgi:phosphate transport system substrate-binding protein
MILVVVACVVSYMCFTNDVEIIEHTEKENLFTIENYPVVDGAQEMLPIAENFKSYYTGTDIKDINVAHSKSHNAYVNLINDSADLILVPYPTESELKMAETQGVELEIRPVAKDAFIFFVNGSNPVKSLTLSQIQNIYSGKTKNWKDVGGNNIGILAFQRPTNSVNQNAMTDLVIHGNKLMKPITGTVTHDGREILDVISDYNNTENAIGYSYSYYYKNIYTTRDMKILSIDGIQPTYENVQTGLYDLQTVYYAIIRKDEPEDSKARKLLNCMISAEGQELVKEAGYVQNY